MVRQALHSSVTRLPGPNLIFLSLMAPAHIPWLLKRGALFRRSTVTYCINSNNFLSTSHSYEYFKPTALFAVASCFHWCSEFWLQFLWVVVTVLWVVVTILCTLLLFFCIPILALITHHRLEGVCKRRLGKTNYCPKPLTLNPGRYDN